MSNLILPMSLVVAATEMRCAPGGSGSPVTLTFSGTPMRTGMAVWRERSAPLMLLSPTVSVIAALS